MHYQEIIGIVAGTLALAGYVPYIISIIRKKTIPNKATWYIWTIVGGLLAFSFLAEGDQKAIWLPLGYFLGPFIVAILSLRYGYSEWTRLDTICIIAAVVSIIPWLFSKNAILTLLINVLIDSTGAIPTLVKTFREPETEDLLAWAIFFIANTLELFAIDQWDLTVAYPLYLFFLAAGMVLLILKGKITSSGKID